MANNGSGKHRKKGDWIAIAQGRLHVKRDLVNGRGVSNIPVIGQVGSAAYRRRTQKGGN